MPTCPARRRWLLACASLPLAACGFHLRGPRDLPFETVFVTGAVGGSVLALIRSRIAASGTSRTVDKREGASAVLELLGVGRERNIIGLSGAGKVREYEFRLGLRFRLFGREGRELIPDTTLSATREATWDDGAVLAKEQEEALLYADMEEELVRQLMRRLEAAPAGA